MLFWMGSALQAPRESAEGDYDLDPISSVNFGISCTFAVYRGVLRFWPSTDFRVSASCAFDRRGLRPAGLCLSRGFGKTLANWRSELMGLT